MALIRLILKSTGTGLTLELNQGSSRDQKSENFLSKGLLLSFLLKGAEFTQTDFKQANENKLKMDTKCRLIYSNSFTSFILSLSILVLKSKHFVGVDCFCSVLTT